MNRRIDDLMSGKKKPDKKNMIFAGIVILLLILTMFGLIFVSTLVGFVTENYFSGKAGYVYELILNYQECASLWSGAFGAGVLVPGYNNQQDLVVSSCGMYDANFLFSCLQPGMPHVLMASLVPSSGIDWTTLQAASTADVDAYINGGSTLMSANKTFTQSVQFQVNNVQYTVPGTYTFNSTYQPGYDMGILKDGNGNIIYITHISDNFTRGFNNKLYNYQMILPVPNGTNPDYFFFTDPAYVCPAGQGVNPDFGNVIGNVTSSTGEKLPGVIVVVGGKSAVTDANGFYNISVSAGNYYIFGILSGYQSYSGNVSIVAFNTTEYDFVMVPQAVPNPNTGPGVGPGVSNNNNVDVGPGKSVGPGQAPKVPIVEQPKQIEGIDYIISISKIDRKLVIGNFLQELISFYSYKKGVAQVSFSIEDQNDTNSSDYQLSSLIKLDKTTMSLAPNTGDQLAMTVFGNGKPGVYNGSLVIDGDLKEKIPVTIELLDKDKIPVQALLISLDLNKRNFYSNEQVKLKTDLQNLLSDQSYPVELQFTIQNLKGKTVWSDSANVYVQTSFSLLKSIQLPNNIPTGDYVLRVSADYLGLSGGASTSFSVILPFYEVTFWGMKMWLWMTIVGALLLLVLAYILVRRYINSKKRYAFKLELNELPKPGPKSAFVGKIAETDHKTYFDLEQFKVHTIVAGATGGGKSVAAQVIVEEALLKGIAVIVFDPTAQWSGMLRKCQDKFMLSLYPNFGMKPTQARAFNGNVRQIINPLELIDIKQYMKPGEIQILACNKLDPKDIDIFVANSIREVFHANFNETPEIRLFLVYDEVHRLLPKFGGSGEGFLQIERGCREFRKWGVGILMISQVLADFIGQIKANINTEIQMRTRDESDLNRIKEKYGTEVLQGLVKASVGSGMVENPTYNRGRPYFVSFRPLLHNTQRLPDEELEKYNKYNEIIDNAAFQIEQLEELKQDVFDLKLQLKLSLDKVKSGNFNMVEIYMQEVGPRLEKLWKKLGKQPKKRVVKTIDLSALKDEMKKGEEERKKAEQLEKKDSLVEAKKDEKKVLKYDYVVDLKDDLNFSNGVSIGSLQELCDVMPNITGPTFRHHVTKDKNDIADWIKSKFADEELASKLRECKVTDDFVRILTEDRLKNNKPLDFEKLKKDLETAKNWTVFSANPETTPSTKDGAPVTVVATPPVNPDTGEGESVTWNDIKPKLKSLSNDDQVKLLEKAVKKYPQDVNIKFPLAMLYQKRKDYDKSEKMYKEILELYPKNTRALFYLGGTMKSQKRYDDAIKYLKIYLDIKKSDPKVKELVQKLEEKNKK